MRNENPSPGQQSHATNGELLHETFHATPVVPSEEVLGETIRGGSLVGEAGHLAVLAAGARVTGNTDPYSISYN